MDFKSSNFPSANLRKVEDQKNHVVLASGGPLMTVENVDGDWALCWWLDGDGKVARTTFPVRALRSLVPYIQEYD